MISTAPIPPSKTIKQPVSKYKETKILTPIKDGLLTIARPNIMLTLNPLTADVLN